MAERLEMSRAFWMAFRQALLTMLDALERELGISPRTAELRHEVRHTQKGM